MHIYISVLNDHKNNCVGNSYWKANVNGTLKTCCESGSTRMYKTPISMR